MKTILKHVQFELKRQSDRSPYSMALSLYNDHIWSYMYTHSLAGLFREVYTEDMFKDLIFDSSVLLGKIPKTKKKKSRK